jgi:UDP-N-acetylmuramoylalanine--D-glutamate ligase
MNKEIMLNKKVGIIGAARSGVAIAKLMKKVGAIPFVSDMASSDKLKNFLLELDNENIQYECGKHTEKLLDSDIVVISPGVPSNVPIVTQLLDLGKKVVSEIEAAYYFNKAKLIGITGSNGKTTTTSLTYEMFKLNGKKSFLAGNVGDPFSNYVLDTNEEYYGVLELSSFQLDHIETFKPVVSVILNITPDHIDRYGSFENYINSKARIFMNQKENDFLIYNSDDKIVSNIVERANCRKLKISIQSRVTEGAFVEDNVVKIIFDGNEFVLINCDEIFIRGKHNLYNSLAASMAGYVSGLKKEEIIKALKVFKGVEHRLEFVRELGGVKFYNDSKATNVDSVWYALDSFTSPVILIAGGKDKGNDYTDIIPLVKEKVKNAVLIGEGADKLGKALNGITSISFAQTMEEAVKVAYDISKHGDVVLLSPACASFDMFNNYEHRGLIFKNSVMAI